MNRDQVRSTLASVLQSFNRYGESMSDFTKLEEDLGVDSLGILILIAELEATFGIRIDAERERTRSNFGTVAELQNFIIEKLDEKSVSDKL